MEKEFIPYEQALALKELGFDAKCIATITNYGYLHIKGTRGFPSGGGGMVNEHKIDCPTFSQAFRWFREKYKLHSRVFFDGLKELEETDEERYDFDVVEQWTIGKDYFDYSYGFKHLYSSRGIYMSYEEAELECLKKLIKIVSK